MSEDKSDMDLMRRLNEKLHAKIKQDAIDSRVAIMEVHRLYAPDWEQPHITGAIDDLRAGFQPDYVPIRLLIEQAEQVTDEELEQCRNILRKARA